MRPSKSLVAWYPSWMRCLCVLLHASCFPGLIVATCLGAGVPWEFVVVSAVLSERALAIVARPRRQHAGPVYRLVATIVRARFSRREPAQAKLESPQSGPARRMEEAYARISD